MEHLQEKIGITMTMCFYLMNRKQSSYTVLSVFVLGLSGTHLYGEG